MDGEAVALLRIFRPIPFRSSQADTWPIQEAEQVSYISG